MGYIRRGVAVRSREVVMSIAEATAGTALFSFGPPNSRKMLRNRRSSRGLLTLLGT